MLLHADPQGYDCTLEQLQSGAAVRADGPELKQISALAASTGIAIAVGYAEATEHGSCPLVRLLHFYFIFVFRGGALLLFEDVFSTFPYNSFSNLFYLVRCLVHNIIQRYAQLLATAYETSHSFSLSLSLSLPLSRSRALSLSLSLSLSCRSGV